LPLPATVTDALARLSALSSRPAPAPQPAAARTPATPQPPAAARPAQPARSASLGTPQAAAPGPRLPRQPDRAPQVHIGAIEVTIAAPAPPPARPPAPQPAPAPAPPTGRLSRPGTAFGLGQG
jgi:hypothetical protein